MTEAQEELTTSVHPEGTVTLLFTDIQGSTELWEQYGNSFQPVLEQHNRLLRELITKWGGYEVKTEGDAFMIAFQRASDAAQWAVEAQIELAHQTWGLGIGEILVRMGMHTGEPLLGYDARGLPDYFGPDVNRAARVASAGHGGQILFSSAAQIVARNVLPPEFAFENLGSHRLKGLQQTEQIYQAAHPLLTPRPFPPLKTLSAHPHNLPVQLTSFVGREQQVKDVCDLLRQPDARLVSLVGPGGTGKTRLSLQVAEEMVDEFTDGAWFVDWSESTIRDQATVALASVLGITPKSQVSLNDEVLGFLSNRSLLLVLDNCEQFPDVGKLVGDMLKLAPRIKAVCTTRNMIRLRGERVYDVPPLRLPPRRAAGDLLQSLSQYECAALFFERARAVKADFEATDETAPVLVELLHQLDGIPLAIELAAARARSLTLPQMLNQFTRRLDFLKSRSADIPERHRTLRAAIDFSHDLLSDDEKNIMAQLAVFSGGFFMEAVEAVCTDFVDGFDLVEELQTKSLLRASESLGKYRFGMLLVVRDYALEKLGDAPELYRRHAEYYLDYLRERDEARDKSTTSFDEIEADLDNIRAGMDWSAANGDASLCISYALSLFNYQFRRGLWQEGAARIATAIQMARAQSSPPLSDIARLQYNASQFFYDLGNLSSSETSCKEALQTWQQLNDAVGVSLALNHLGNLADDQGRSDEARQLYEASLEQRRSLNDQRGIADCLHNLALLAKRSGDAHKAKELYEESLALHRSTGDLSGTALTLNNLGVLALEENDWDRAEAMYRECLQLRRKLGNIRAIAVCLHNLGEIALRKHDGRRAARLLVAAHRMLSEIQSPLAAEPASLIEQLREQEGENSFQVLHAYANGLTTDEVLKIIDESGTV